MTETQQLHLPITFSERLDFSTYVTGANSQITRTLLAIAGGEQKQNIFLWGGSGVGKTHLLQAVCMAAGDLQRTAAYVPLKLLGEIRPEVLLGLEDYDVVCLDDVDCIAGDQTWESAIFNLFNACRENRRPLLMTAAVNPNRIPVQMVDLHTRLGWDLVFQLRSLADGDRLQALVLRARSRGLDVSAEVLQYLLQHVPRDTHTLFGWLQRLDQECLARKRRLTIPFIRELLDSPG